MNTMTLTIKMPDDIESQYDCPSSSSSFSSGAPMTPSHSYSDFSRRPSTASCSSWAQCLSANSSFSSQQSTAPSTPPNGKAYYSMDPFVPHAPYNFSSPGENTSIFTEESSVDLSDEHFMMSSGPRSFTNKHLANWELVPFGDGSLGTPFIQAHRQSSVDIQDHIGFTPATGLDAFFSRPMFDRSQTDPDFTSLPHTRRHCESAISVSPQTIVPSQTFARPTTPVSALADGFHTPVHTPIRTPVYTSVKSEASVSPHEPFPSYSPYMSPSLESSPPEYFHQVQRTWERRFTASVLDYGCKTPSPTSRAARKGPRHAGQSLMDRSPFIVSKGDKVHKCYYPGCDGAFKRQEHLKRHQKKHAKDENPFKCIIRGCKKMTEGFNRTDNLNAHFRTHLRPEDGGNGGKGGRNMRLTREEAREYGRIYGIKIFQIPLSNKN